MFFFFSRHGHRASATVEAGTTAAHILRKAISASLGPGNGPQTTSLMATEASWAVVISSWFAARGCAGRARRRWKKSKFLRMTGLVSHRQNLLAPPLPCKWPSGSCMRP